MGAGEIEGRTLSKYMEVNVTDCYLYCLGDSRKGQTSEAKCICTSWFCGLCGWTKQEANSFSCNIMKLVPEKYNKHIFSS